MESKENAGAMKKLLAFLFVVMIFAAYWFVMYWEKELFFLALRWWKDLSVAPRALLVLPFFLLLFGLMAITYYGALRCAIEVSNKIANTNGERFFVIGIASTIIIVLMAINKFKFEYILIGAFSISLIGLGKDCL